MNRFGDYTPHANMYIGETLDHLLEGRCNVDDILTMNVMKRNGEWFTSDNRRLWVFRKTEEIGFLETVKVNVIYYISNNKFTTVNHGRSVRVRRGGPEGRIWTNWKPQRPISNTVRSYQPCYYLNRSDASSGNSFTRRYTTIRDNVSYSCNENRHGTHLSFHSNSSQNCDSLFPVSYHENVTKPARGIICVGDLDNKVQLDTEQLSPRQSIHLDKMSSDKKSTERADDVQSYNQSVISDRQASLDQSCGNRNNMDDVRSHIPSVISDRQASLDQSCENRNNMDDVRSHIPSVISDRQASLDQSCENRNNMDDVRSHNPSVISDRQTSLDQSCENRNNMDDVRSHNPSVISDRQTSLDQSCENRNNMDDIQSHRSSILSARQASFDPSCENRNNMDDVRSHISSVISDRQASLDQSCGNRNRMDDIRSHIPSVISNRQTSLDQSWEIRSNLGDVQSYRSLILSDRQASLDQSWGKRNKLGDVQSYKSSVMSDRKTSLDQSWRNRNNADVDQSSVRRETLGSTPRLRHKKEEDGCCCVIL